MEGSMSLSALGVVLLAAITQATLQVAAGTMLLLYHASSGKHIREKTRNIVADYVSGVLAFVALIVAALGFGVQVGLQGGMDTLALTIATGVLMVLAVCSWAFYYKTGRATELWIPRTVSRYIEGRAKKTESNIEAMSIGALTVLADLPFSLILMVLAANGILAQPYYLQPMLVFLYAIVATAPLTVMRFAIKSGRNVVEMQKWRVRNKGFLRLMTGVLFATLAGFVIVFEVMK